MRILLTGASGFIGSYFKKHYEEKYDMHTFSFLKDHFEFFVHWYFDKNKLFINLLTLKTKGKNADFCQIGQRKWFLD